MIQKWRDTTAPYRPGAKHTQAFGLRINDIGSPLHPGNDRGKEPRDILAPFDGELVWNRVAGVAGSVLQLIPSYARCYVEIQVFHTVPESEYVNHIKAHVHRGEALPVKAGDIGLSTGVHTHTEVVVKDGTEITDEGVPIYVDGEFNEQFIRDHCKRYGLDFADVIKRATEQVKTWEIRYMSTHYAIRRGVPDYRTPHWGAGETIHVDPRWMFDI